MIMRTTTTIIGNFVECRKLNLVCIDLCLIFRSVFPLHCCIRRVLKTSYFVVADCLGSGSVLTSSAQRTVTSVLCLMSLKLPTVCCWRCWRRHVMSTVMLTAVCRAYCRKVFLPVWSASRHVSFGVGCFSCWTISFACDTTSCNDYL